MDFKKKLAAKVRKNWYSLFEEKCKGLTIRYQCIVDYYLDLISGRKDI